MPSPQSLSTLHGAGAHALIGVGTQGGSWGHWVFAGQAMFEHSLEPTT
jgi:hypothetical protein